MTYHSFLPIHSWILEKLGFGLGLAEGGRGVGAGGRGVGGGGGVMMTTLSLHKSRFTRYLQCFRDVGPSYIVTKPTCGLCELDFGISEGFRRKIEIGWGGSFFGDDHDTDSRTPRTISPYLERRHHTVLQKQTLLHRGLGFRGVGELLPRTAGIFVFDGYKMLRIRF